MAQKNGCSGDNNSENGFVYCNCGCWEYEANFYKKNAVNDNRNGCAHCEDAR